MKIYENHFRVASKALELAVQSRVFPECVMEHAEKFYKFLTQAPDWVVNDKESFTDIEIMVKILYEAKIPLHTDEIIKRFGRPEKAKSLTSSLYRYSTRGSLFKKTGPGCFALISDN